ncbi:MAG: VanW family protein [Clostridia bacterium]|nr:VanW family protein [Clostridia bacterium]
MNQPGIPEYGKKQPMQKPRVTLAPNALGAGNPPPETAQTASHRKHAHVAYQHLPAYNGDVGYRLMPAAQRKKKKRHPILSAFISLIALALIAAALYFGLPMFIGSHAPYAIANGYILEYDSARLSRVAESLALSAQYFERDAFLPGISIDNVYVGGMTRPEAAAALGTGAAAQDAGMSVTVTAGNKRWTLDSDRLQIKRNTDILIERAYALGRTAVFSGDTPYEQRLKNAWDYMNQEGKAAFYSQSTYDRNAVSDFADEIALYVNRPAQDSQVAGFDFVRKTFAFTESAPGVTIDAEQLKRDIWDKLDKREKNASLTVEPQIIMPMVNKDDLIGEFKLLATYTTKTTNNANRNTNVRLSAQEINGRAVNPGQTFSFNDTVGKRTVEKGYKEAIAISGGQTVPDIGGGVCQTSGTLFNAVARADLEIVYRSPHAWPSTYVQKGMDATVNWPGLDFKFKNNKDTPIFIVAYYADRLITVEIYGKSLGAGITIDLESEVTRTMKPPNDIRYVNNPNMRPGTSKETIQPRTGYEVNTYKVWYKDGKEYHRELFFQSTYKMYQRTVEYN